MIPTLVATLAMEPLLDHRQFVQIALHQDLRWHVSGLVVELLDERGHHLRLALILGAGQHKVLAPDELAAADEKDLHAGLAILAGKGDEIVVVQVAGDDALPLDNLADGGDLVAHLGGLLEIGAPLPQRTISPRSSSTIRSCLPSRKRQARSIICAIFLRGRGADAGPHAALDMVVKAGPPILAGDLAVAGAVGEEAPQQLQALVHAPARR